MPFSLGSFAGALFASLAVMESACVCFGQIVVMSIYKSTLNILPGFVFFACGVFHLSIIVIYM